ncbi:MAG TPA: helix-hairpin-helix domain-containing protein [Thermoplasmata archaeon]|nr:helix-hairpin-helix domain-containing protein [Thermoplasmata archaeon]
MTANDEVSEVLLGIADLLDLQGERFKPEAYRRAARSIVGAGEDLRALRRDGRLSEIPGVGEAIQRKIEEFLDTGRVDYYERLKQSVPPGVVVLIRMPGVGPKTAARFQRELGIDRPEALRSAIDGGRLTGVAGFGPKKIENLRRAVENAPSAPAGRFPVRAAWTIARRVVESLQGAAPVDHVEIAGSLRRRRETVGDLDILATSASPRRAIEAFAGLPGVREVVAKGDTKCTVIFDPGIQIDLRVVGPESFGAALQYFTGSKDHNVRLRTWARDRGLKINEYGVYRGEERLAGATEEEVYRSLGLPWIPPEIRENAGELDAAFRGKLPRLLEAGDLRGELHQHIADPTDRSALERWASNATRRGFQYVGGILPRGPSGELAGPQAIDRVRAAWPKGPQGKGPRLLIGAEVEGPELAKLSELPEGVDYLVLRAGPGPAEPPETTREPRGAPLAWFVGHLPTSKNSPAESADLAGRWIRYARSTHLALEVTPDGASDGLDSRAIRLALDAGCSLVVNAGSASLGDFTDLELAVGLARRGWAGPERVLNASDHPDPGPGRTPRRSARPRGGPEKA